MARLLLLSIAVSLLSACASVQTARVGKLPNVIVILADDLGHGDLGSYGGTAFPTPNLDALARSGVRYTDGYATAAVCAPSRAGLLAGRHQARFGFEFNPVGRDERLGMPPAETTFAEHAKAAGYRTALIGKWHIGQGAGYHPLDQGFDSFFGLLGGATNFFPDADPGVVTAETAGDRVISRARFPIMRNREIVDPPGDLTDVFAEAAARFIAENASAPFLLYLPLTAPHTPLQTAQADAARFAHIASPHARIYASMVTKLDDAVGRVMQALNTAGATRNTVIVFASDNGCPSYIGGACSNGKLSGWKAYPWEGGIRVPFIVSAPGRLTPGVETRPVSLLDVMPTVVELTGIGTARPVEGYSLLSPPPERALFWRMGPNHAVRQGRWKLLVVNKSATVQSLNDVLGQPTPDGVKAGVSPLGQWTLLFDLKADPGETSDVAARHPEVVARLKASFAAWDRSNVEPVFTSRRQFRSEIDGRKIQLFN
jgi:arylsulfatase A-like enzyme